MKNKLVLSGTVLWAILAALNEGGIIDIIPIENEKTVNWIKFIIAFLVIVGNAVYYAPNRTQNEDPEPPDTLTGNEDPEPPKGKKG